MSPIVLLREKAVVTCVEETPPTTASHIKPAPASESSLNDFMSYVDTLLVPQAQFLSPSSTPHGQLIIPPLPTPIRGTMIQELSSRENIEMALLQGSSGNGYLTPDSRCSIFEICRNGHKVASLTLARPAYKLGDTIIAVLDFANAVIPCYHVCCLFLPPMF